MLSIGGTEGRQSQRPGKALRDLADHPCAGGVQHNVGRLACRDRGVHLVARGVHRLLHVLVYWIIIFNSVNYIKFYAQLYLLKTH